MAEQPSKRELELAARVNELHDAAERPSVAGVGIFSLAVNFLMGHITRGMMTVGLLVFIAYQGWAAFNDSQQATADLQTKRAEVGQTQAEAAAINANVEGGPMQLETLLAQVAKTQAEADQLKADADAQTQIFNGMPVAVAQKLADVAALEAELKKQAASLHVFMSVAQ